MATETNGKAIPNTTAKAVAQKSAEKTSADNNVAKPQGGAELRFDAAQVKSSYANFANINSTQEEVVLNFGMDRSWDRTSGERVIELQHRIVMSPFAAKRLAKMMAELVTSYEQKYGQLPNS
jgi:hypothetical protein